MQKKSIFFHFLCIIFSILFAGCGRVKQEKSDLHKKSFFSRVKEKCTGKSKQTVPVEAIKAFDLDADTLNTFAIDDQLEQHKQVPPQLSSSSSSSYKQHGLLAWENLAAEATKDSFDRMLFEFNSYILQPKQLKDLKHNIKQAKKMIKQGKTIVIEGHACHSAGSAIYNLALSEKRARHVAKEFAKAGIDSKHIKIAPRGHEMPLRKDGNREEQAINRRVEIFAIDSN